jgi:putative NIF3 family GTP cyclohydrolase 1 type 2
MNRHNLTRREFSALFGAGLSTLTTAQAASVSTAKLTAGEVVERIKSNLKLEWNDKTYRDTFKIGRADMPVRGIATTFMSNLEVLQRAKSAGLNMIISHEPTFWSDADLIPPVQNDPLYRLKLDFGNRNDLIVWRFHDHWHARNPDGIFEGWNRALGWEKYLLPGDARKWELPPTTLGAVARHMVTALKSRSIRVIGDPALPVRTIGRGAHVIAGNMTMLPQVDAMIVSEAREWDSLEYIRDTVLSGQRKGAIVIAHEAGEEAGMENCANWVRGFVSEVPVRFVETRDQMWIPA